MKRTDAFLVGCAMGAITMPAFIELDWPWWAVVAALSAIWFCGTRIIAALGEPS